MLSQCPFCTWKQDAGKAGLLLADFRALPGMEGSPVLDSSCALVGMVVTPLCISGYELPLILPVAALDAAISPSLPDAPSVSRYPACSTAATAAHRTPQCCSSRQQHQQQTQPQPGEPAAQLERAKCSAAAAATAAMGASPAVTPVSNPAQHAAALLQATRGVVGCSLSTGQWASGILVNR